MELAHRWQDRNLTRLELVVAWLIIAVIIGAFIRSMLVVFTKAERTMVNTTINSINTALKYQAVIAIMRGDRKFIFGLAQENPFKFVQSQQGISVSANADGFNELSSRISAFTTLPSNYLGELFDPDPGTLKAGYWYFDRFDNTLNYLVRIDEYFHSDLNGVSRIKLKVVVDYNDVNGDKKFGPGLAEFKSVSLQSIGKYFWTE